MSNEPAPAAAPPTGRKPIYSLLTMMVAVACVVLPVMFWHGTWFGRHLSDEQLATYLAATDQPRKLQHALTELTRRIDARDADGTDAGDAGLDRFYPAVAALAAHPRWPVRSTTAWVMGRDHRGAGFHDALLTLLHDPVLVVRHNAALALTNFEDDAGHDVILSMLESTPATTPAGGVLTGLLPVDAAIRVDLRIGQIDTDGHGVVDLPAPITGRIGHCFFSNGDRVAVGDVVYAIEPGELQIIQALRALGRLGRASDVGIIERVRDRASSTAAVVEQAGATIAAIQRGTAGS